MPRNSGPEISARSWSALLEFDEIDIEGLYEQVLCNLAMASYHDKLDAEPAPGFSEAPKQEAPDISNPEEIYMSLGTENHPEWWPAQLERIDISVRVRPVHEQPNQFSNTFDPNAKDHGKGGFLSLVKSLCEAIGIPFEGNVELRVIRKRDRYFLGGWRAEVEVGIENYTRQSSRTQGVDDAMNERAMKHAADTQDAMMQMFQQSSNVISASAAALNAMRNANPPAPWMQQQESNEQPFWIDLAQQAMMIVGGSGMLTGGNQQTGQVAGQLMNMPIKRGNNPAFNHPMGGHQTQQGPPELPMYNNPQDDLGYQDYLLVEDEPDGDYDGYYVDEGDILDEDFYEEEENYDEPLFEENYDSGGGFQPQPPPQPRPHSGPSNNPIAGMSPEEVSQYMNEWLDEGHDKNQVRQLGMGLVGKVMK